jgi:hypothetical protein
MTGDMEKGDMAPESCSTSPSAKSVALSVQGIQDASNTRMTWAFAPIQRAQIDDGGYSMGYRSKNQTEPFSLTG